MYDSDKARYKNYAEFLKATQADNSAWEDYEYAHLASVDDILAEYPELRDMDDALNGASYPPID